MKCILKFKNINHVFEMIKTSTVSLNNPYCFNDPIDSYFCTLFGGSKNGLPAKLHEYVDIANDLRVFCGTKSENINNVLMWSHYANFHKGVAIKYIVPEDKENLVNEVDYLHIRHEEFIKAIGNGNPKNIPDYNAEQKREMILRSVFEKTNEWCYEKEIRYAKFLSRNDSNIEQGWKVVELYLGYKYLDSTQEELKEIIRIIDLCIEKKIKIYTMSYEYNENIKKFVLHNNPWLSSYVIDEMENYEQIRRSILNTLKGKYLESQDGLIVKSIIEDICIKAINSILDKKIGETIIRNKSSEK
jgi:hypothetical protein